MSVSRRATPRGQILLIVAFAMVALLAIGAIVVDLGLSWMLRRQEQNAADPAAIAASRYIEEGDSAATRTKMDAAACFYAKRNGFFSADNDTCDAARTAGTLQIHWPPISGDFAGRPQMVQVIISADHQSFFGQFFGRPTATVTTGAVAARESTSANTNSLVALDPETCDAGKTHGNGVVTIAPVTNPDSGDPYNGGYVHVNSSCSPTGTYDDACGSGSGAFHQGGNAGTKIVAPMIYIHGTCQQSGGTVVSPVTEGAPPAPDPMAGLFGPRQQDYPVGHCPVKQGNKIIYVNSQPGDSGCVLPSGGVAYTLTPGVYYGGWNFTKKDATIRLLPGIYIIAGGGISTTQGTIDSTPAAIGGGPDPSADPARILIYGTDNLTDPACAASIALARDGQPGWLARCVQGQIKISGQAGLRIWGLDSGPWKGLLLWQDRRSSNPTAPVDLTGQGVLDLAGSIYAPKADVKITGNGNAFGTRLAVQIISWTWDIGGNGNLYMPYDPANLYHITQQGLVD
jgi:hypothetical protein